MEDYVTDENYDEDEKPGLCAGIVVEGTDGNYYVKLRFDDNHKMNSDDKKQQVPPTSLDVVNVYDHKIDEEPFLMYRVSGFTFLQYMVTKILSRSSGSPESPGIRIGIVPMMTPEYIRDDFLASAGSFMGMIVILSYLAPVFRVVSLIVQDKELKTREGMNMMGLKDSAYWLSFLVYYFIIFLVIAILMASIEVIFIFKRSNWFLTVIFFFLFGLSVFAFGFAISMFFYRSRVASITATMIYFASMLIQNLIDDESTGESAKNAAGLFPTLAWGLGMINYVEFESGQSGVSFSNATTFAKNYRFSNALIMLTVDIFLYGIIGLYLDNVIPNQNGVSKPFYYFLTCDYWRGKSKDKIHGTDNTDELLNKNEDDILYPDEHFEKVGEELKEQEVTNDCLKIRQLNKYMGQKHSVCDLSVNMYKGHILAL